MGNDRVICPYCGYRMPIEVKPDAVAYGLLTRCKGRNCGKIFEIVIPDKNKQKISK